MTLFGKKKPILKKARKRDMPDGLWIKCPGCNEMIFREEQEKALRVCPLCDHHFPMSRAERLAMLADPGSFVEWDRDLYSIDFLGFVGEASYQEKLEANRRKTGEVDAVTCGRARLNSRAIALGVMDFEFPTPCWLPETRNPLRWVSWISSFWEPAWGRWSARRSPA